MIDQTDLIDYVGFFEAEPEILSPDVVWNYGAKFVSTRAENKIIAVIAPGDLGFTFRWWQSGILRANFNFYRVIDWKLENTPKKETLFI